MHQLQLVSKQPGSHAYKESTIERPDILNILNREFDIEARNQICCCDITYIWAQGKWHYFAVVMDLYARRVVGWAVSEKPDADLVMKNRRGSCWENAPMQRVLCSLKAEWIPSTGYMKAR